jgi:hypothetical protein
MKRERCARRGRMGRPGNAFSPGRLCTSPSQVVCRATHAAAAALPQTGVDTGKVQRQWQTIWQQPFS